MTYEMLNAESDLHNRPLQHANVIAKVYRLKSTICTIIVLLLILTWRVLDSISFNYLIIFRIAIDVIIVEIILVANQVELAHL